MTNVTFIQDCHAMVSFDLKNVKVDRHLHLHIFKTSKITVEDNAGNKNNVNGGYLYQS